MKATKGFFYIPFETISQLKALEWQQKEERRDNKKDHAYEMSEIW